MSTRELTRDQKHHTPRTAPTPPIGGDSAEGEEIRRRAKRLLDLGDETISQALSHNSRRFLAQNRQQGGQ